MAVHCGTHGVQHSTKVCRHISSGIRTGRNIKTGYKAYLDTDNLKKFTDEVLVCRTCRDKMIGESCVTRLVLEDPWIVTIEDMIGEGGYVPHLDHVCNRCLEGIDIASKFLPVKM